MNLITDYPAPAYIDYVNYPDAINPDIITQIEKNFRPASLQVKEFAKRFQGSDIRTTAFNVWKFLKDNITYQADGKRQKILFPSRLIADGVGDCKSYSLFIASIMSHFAPVAFRYVSYNKKNKTPSHVYTLIKTEYGWIPVDGVWNEFGTEKTFAHKIDHKMTVETLTGIESVFTPDQISRVRNRIASLKTKWREADPGSPQREAIANRIRVYNRALKNDDTSILQELTGIADRAARQERRENRQEKRQERKSSGKASGAKKIALAPGRAAFLEIVNLNVRGIATRLSKLPTATVTAKWKKLGGKEEKILNAIAKGKVKKPLLGESKKNKALKGIGVVTIAAALALAAPVLLAISKILPPGDPGDGTTSVSELLQEAGEAGGNLSIDPEGNDVDIIDKGKGADQGGLFSSIPTPVKIVGGIALLYGGAKVAKIIK